MHTPSSQPPAHKKLPHTEVLWGIKNRISELLDSEAFLLQNQELERLFTQLNDALDAKVKNAWYDYKDYKQRLFRWEEKLEAILLQDQALKVHYENILRAIKFAPYLKQTLWDKILFDRVLELWPPAQEFPKPDTISFDALKRTPSIPPYIIIKDLPHNASVQELEEVFSKIENTPWVLSIDLWYNNLWDFWLDQLQAIFSHLWNVRSIDVRGNDLYKLDEPRLQAIFFHLWNVRSIDLWDNGLWEFDEARLQAIFLHLGNVKNIHLKGNRLWNFDTSSLHAIFSHLSWVRSIDLIYNYLWELDEPSLQTIFSHLWGVRSFDLSRNHLWKLDEPRLQAIFSHLGNVRSLKLWDNDLWQLDEPRLQAIFSHLWDVRSIDLSGNSLYQLDELSLHAIFSHLTQIEEVILDSQGEGSMLESFFPNLIGKIKIV